MAKYSKDVTSEEKAENHAKEDLKEESGDEANGDEEAVDQRSLLLQEKSPWNKEHSSDKDEEGMSERDALTGNNKRKDTPYKHGLFCVSKKFFYENIMPLGKILLLLGCLTPVAAGQQLDNPTQESRYRILDINQTKAATKAIPIPPDRSRFSIVSTGTGTGTRDYSCTVAFVSQHKNCSIIVGDEKASHCEGLHIRSHNASHMFLAVDWSNLTNPCSFFCVHQLVPENYALYSSLMCKIPEGNTTAVAPTATTLDPARDDPNSGPQNNVWKWLFGASLMLVVILVVYVIVVKKCSQNHYDRLILSFTKDNSGGDTAVHHGDADPKAPVQEDAESSADSGAPSGLNTRDGSFADVAAMKESISIPLADQEDLSA